jgi:hypothetical protein
VKTKIDKECKRLKMRRAKLVTWFIVKKTMDVVMAAMSGMGGFFVAELAGLPGWTGLIFAIMIILYMDTEYIQRKDRGPALEDYLPSGD